MLRPLSKLRKVVCRFLTELNILSPYDLAIVLLGAYPKELNTYVHTKTFTWMFIAALFIMPKTWKQPRCPQKLQECTNCGPFRQWDIIPC